MRSLEPISKHIRVLKKEESDRLLIKDPNLPRSLKDCITCGGKRSFRWFVNHGFSDEIDDYQCNCEEQFVLYKYLLNAGIGKRYQRYDLGDLDKVEPVAMAAAAEYLENSEHYIRNGVGFFFQGERGTGKTLLAAILLKQLLNEGVDGYFTTFNDMLDNYASGWTNDNEREWFDSRVRSAPLLVVDDIGKEAEGRLSVSKPMVDNIFRGRVNDSLPTIITTNLDPNELSYRYSTALETIAGKAKAYVFKGKSYRNSDLETERLRFELDNKLTRPIVIS